MRVESAHSNAKQKMMAKMQIDRMVPNETGRKNCENKLQGIENTHFVTRNLINFCFILSLLYDNLNRQNHKAKIV